MGDDLLSYMKKGPTPELRASDVLNRLVYQMQGAVVSVSDAIARYEDACKGFMDNTILNRGMPIREVGVTGDGRNTRNDPRKAFGKELINNLEGRYRFCVENFAIQAKKYFGEEILGFQRELSQFLRLVPVGGTKDKEIKARISSIKKTAKFLFRWHEYFAMHKAASFSSEVEFVLSLQEDDVIAARWRYSPLDEQCDIKREHDHRELNAKIYLVRDNWALRKGLIDERAAPFVQDILRPKQDVGCMCELIWIRCLRDLPESFLSDAGKKARERAQNQVERLLMGDAKHKKLGDT